MSEQNPPPALNVARWVALIIAFYAVAEVLLAVFIQQKQLLIEIWLDYEKDPSCELRLRIYQLHDGATSDIAKESVFTEADMQEAIVLDEDFTSFIGIN